MDLARHRRPPVKHGFDRLAPIYDGLELLAFGGALRRSQTRLLPQLPPVRRTLLVGGGTGCFLEALATQSACTIDCLDISEAMLARSKSRIQRRLPEALSRIHFIQGDVAEFARDEPYDLICTLCLLDCFSEADLEPIMARLSGLLAPGGTWLFHDFEPQGPCGRSLVWLLYRFFRLTTAISAKGLPDMPAAFARHGFAESASCPALGGLVVSRVYSRDVPEDRASIVPSCK